MPCMRIMHLYVAALVAMLMEIMTGTTIATPRHSQLASSNCCFSKSQGTLMHPAVPLCIHALFLEQPVAASFPAPFASPLRTPACQHGPTSESETLRASATATTTCLGGCHPLG